MVDTSILYKYTSSWRPVHGRGVMFDNLVCDRSGGNSSVKLGIFVRAALGKGAAGRGLITPYRAPPWRQLDPPIGGVIFRMRPNGTYVAGQLPPARRKGFLYRCLHSDAAGGGES